jgi:hypothetical protein
MSHLVETSSGSAVVERYGPYGSLTMFAKDGTEMRRRHFGGRDGLADALIQNGVSRSEADRVATEFWTFWDTHFADAYYTEAKATLRISVGIAGLFAVAMALREARRQLRRLTQ